MRLFAITIFCSSFLVFQVQPLVGKYILPWFGGTPAVWTVCMLFFQSALLGGYAYAHWLVDRFKPARQALIHAGLLLFTLFWLPITPPDALKPDDASWPVLRVLLVLLASVGGPFLLASSTAPLIQSWFSQKYPDRSPYRLYALSNVGSLLGLFAYPFLVEPFLDLSVQTWSWSICYFGFAVLCASAGWQLRRQSPPAVDAQSTTAAEASSPTKQESPKRPPSLDVLLWLLLSACGSVLLLSVTNQLTQNVAAVPFLWVLPLGLYLITFIICFEHDRWYKRQVFFLAWIPAYAVGIWLLVAPPAQLPLHIGLYCFVLFVCCMLCHGELSRLRPAPRHLTGYFLYISLGGALGGLFVSLLAPAIFDQFHEYLLGLFGTGALLIAVIRREKWKALSPEKLRVRFAALIVICLAGAGLIVFASDRAYAFKASASNHKLIARDRNFYGVVRAETLLGTDGKTKLRTFTHGNTMHGFQIDEPDMLDFPTGYYQREAGVGLALRYHPKRLAGKPLRVGVIGLGVGTLAAYGQAGDEMILYEIDPDVETYARKYFSYLDDAEQRGAKLEVILGDGRIMMERQAADKNFAPFDVLVLDAFSSDAVPAHLLTKECFALYDSLLAPGGILATHITNHYLDLEPVVRAGAASIEREAGVVGYGTPAGLNLPSQLLFHSSWLLISNNREFLDHPEVAKRVLPPGRGAKQIQWTDRYSSLLRVLR